MRPDRHLIAAARVAAGLGAATSAAADCAAELDAFASVSTDGTAARLAEPATPQSGAEASEQDAAEGSAKDGTQMPLGETGDLATSAGDAQARARAARPPRLRPRARPAARMTAAGRLRSTRSGPRWRPATRRPASRRWNGRRRCEVAGRAAPERGPPAWILWVAGPAGLRAHAWELDKLLILLVGGLTRPFVTS